MNVGGVVAADVVVVGHSAYCHPLISNNHHYRCCVVVFVFNSRSCSFVVVIRRTIIVRNTHDWTRTISVCIIVRTCGGFRHCSSTLSLSICLANERFRQTEWQTDGQTERARDNQQFSISTTKCVVFDFFVVVVVVNYLTNEWITEWQQQWSGGKMRQPR